jgi:hypothetical protein
MKSSIVRLSLNNSMVDIRTNRSRGRYSKCTIGSEYIKKVEPCKVLYLLYNGVEKTRFTI